MDAFSHDRIPPHNIEAEQAVLGAVFLEPEDFSVASEILMPEDFYRASHQRIFAAMMDLSDKGEPIDLVTVTTLLSNEQQIDEVGGVSYLTDRSEEHTSELQSRFDLVCRLLLE